MSRLPLAHTMADSFPGLRQSFSSPTVAAKLLSKDAWRIAASVATRASVANEKPKALVDPSDTDRRIRFRWAGSVCLRLVKRAA
jgi:hypothetical protein